MDKKVNVDEITDMDAKFMDQINDLVQVMSKKFADKQKTTQDQQDMEKQIRSLFDIIMSRGANEVDEDDTMFTKKPWAGMSCASCEKEVVNMLGKRVEYMPWGKLPVTDPKDSISRRG
jgi:hypothetical protein